MATLKCLRFMSNAGLRFSSHCFEYVVTENFSSHIKAWIQISLSLLQPVCYCLHLIIHLWLKTSNFLFYSEFKRNYLCTLPTCHIWLYHCLTCNCYQQKLATLLEKVCARSLQVKICLQVKINLFFSDVIVLVCQLLQYCN